MTAHIPGCVPVEDFISYPPALRRFAAGQVDVFSAEHV